MQIGAITQYIDVAQIVLYAFWIFFIGLVVYLRKEDKREGYPLDSDRSERSARVQVQGFPRMPAPKIFKLIHSGEVRVPRDEVPNPAVFPIEPFPGAPFGPANFPSFDAIGQLLAGVGPGAYANRADVPDLTAEGEIRIAPMRIAQDFTIASGDVDPRGMAVVGADGEQGGIVEDLWIDRAEPQIRYLEVVTASGRHVLTPIPFVRFDGRRGLARVRSILSTQFSSVPEQANPEQVTLLEEDRISAFYGGGTLYAEPARMGPIL